MPNKFCDITIITHFLCQNPKGIQNTIQTLDLTSRNNYNAERAINKFIRANMMLDAVQLLQNELQYQF